MQDLFDKLWQTLGYRNPWWFGTWRDESVPRNQRAELESQLDRAGSSVIVVTGMRRCGKSTLLKQGVAALLSRGVGPERIWWIDFEDPVFDELGRNTEALDQCFKVLTEKHGVLDQGPPFLFLDEIQLVKGWHRWVRMIHETGRAAVAVSGSSSKLLKSDVALSALTGRTASIELWPLSFREYLRFHGVDSNDPALRSTESLKRHFDRYLQRGGMPGLVTERDDDVARDRLKQLLDSILLHDIVERHKVRAAEDLGALARDYFANTACTFTYRKTKSRFELSMDQVRSYTDYLAEAFLIRVLSKYAHKQHERQRAPRKVHAVDVGIRNASVVTGTPDRGHLAESIASLELIRRGAADRLFWWQDVGAECDLVVKNDSGGTAIQVWMGDDRTPPERERRGIEEARRALQLTDGLILTDGYSMDQPDQGLRAVPIWRWLLEG